MAFDERYNEGAIFTVNGDQTATYEISFPSVARDLLSLAGTTGPRQALFN
jgi:hypothetical protein